VALLDGVAEGVVEHRPLAPLGRPGGRLAIQGLGARAERQPHRRRVIQRADRQGGAGHPAQGGGDLARRDLLAGGGVERPAEQRLPQHPALRSALLLGGQRDGDGDQRLGDRAARDRGQSRPLGLGVAAGMLIPGDHLPLGRLGGRQAGALAERPAAAGRVLEAVEEPVGEGPVPKRLAVLTVIDRPPHPVPAAAAAVTDLLDVPEPDVVTVHAHVSRPSCVSFSRRRSHRVSALRRTRTPPPGSRTTAGPAPCRRQR
jgi:hypothetical protein